MKNSRDGKVFELLRVLNHSNILLLVSHMHIEGNTSHTFLFTDHKSTGTSFSGNKYLIDNIRLKYHSTIIIIIIDLLQKKTK